MNDSLIISKRPVKGRVINKPSTLVLPVETPVIQVDSNMSDEYSNLLELNKKYNLSQPYYASNNSEIVLPIDSLQFSILTPKDIKGISVLEVTNPLMEGTNSIHDPRLGPNKPGRENRCITCNGVYKKGTGDPNEIECPGHWSYIELHTPIPHPLCSKEILIYLRIFCNMENCGRLIFTNDQIKLLNLPKGLILRLEKLSEYRDQVKVCGHCEKNQPKITMDENKYFIQYKGNEQQLRYERISNIFDNIRTEDLDILGIDSELIHPSYFLIKCFPVLPPCDRTFMCSTDGNIGHDDLSFKYVEIVKFNIELKKSISETKNEEILNSMSNTIYYMLDNSKGKAKDSSGHRPIRSLKQRLEGKQGHVRSTQGKRVDYCARTVITGDANCDVDELIIPKIFAEKLTIPVNVNMINIKDCQRLLDEGEVVFIIRGKRRTNSKLALYTKATTFNPCDKLIRNSLIFSYQEVLDLQNKKRWEFKVTDEIVRPNGKIDMYVLMERIPFKLQIGDTIERKIRDGDTAILNRQPTLWKGSMRSKRITLREGKTLRFNVASTQAFNADFDGDEMNIHVCQSLPSIAESTDIISTVENFISSQDSKPMIGFKLDAMSGGYLLTKGIVKIPKWLWDDIMSMLDKDYVESKILHIKKVLDFKINNTNLDKDLLKLKNDLDGQRSLLNDLKLQYDNATGKNIPIVFKKYDKIKSVVSKLEVALDKLVKDNNSLYTGHNLFSIFLPDDMEYIIQNNISLDGKPVVVNRGVLLSGTLSKAAMGSSSGSLLHHISKDYGNKRACKFVSQYSRMINKWLSNQGFSVGIYDCISNNINLINDEVNKHLLKAKSAIDNEKDPDIRETNIKEALNDTTSIGNKIAKQSLKSDNRMMYMVESEAKGSFFNLLQITGMVGQQNVGSSRIEQHFVNRTLPHFEEHITDIRENFSSRGFIFKSYYEGMTPTDTFFAAAGGRPGLIDTAIKTAETGYIQKKMTKILEDLTSSYVGTVNDMSNNIIQFNYGEDNLDAAKLIKVGKKNDKDVFSFIDIKHSILKLNADYEWDLFLNKTSIKSVKRKLTMDELKYIKDELIYKVYYDFYTINTNNECIHNTYSTLEPNISLTDIYPEMIEKLYNEISKQLKTSVVNAGECVGHVASSSMGEIQTQNNLNSFHKSGANKGKDSGGIIRLKELLYATKNPKTKSLTIYFENSLVDTMSLKNIRELSNIYLKERHLKDYIKSFKIDVSPELTNSEKIWYNIYKVYCSNDNINNCKHRLRLVIDTNILFLSKRTLYNLVNSIKNISIKTLNFYVICSSDDIGIIDIWIEDNLVDPKVFFSVKSFESDLMLDTYINNENKLYHLIKKIILPTIKNIHISGIPEIQECFYHQNSSDEWYVTTKGGLIKDLYMNPLINHYTSVSNDMWEMNNIFGIESSKKWLKDEFSTILILNNRHIDILVDKMTFSGTIISVSFYGLDKKVIGPLSKAVFERPVATLLIAAQKAELDLLKSVSSCVAVGNIGRFGTGLIDTVCNQEMILNNPYAEKYYQQSEQQQLLSGEELPEFEEDDELVINDEALDLNEEDIF